MEGAPQPRDPQVDLLTETGETFRLNYQNTLIRTYKQAFCNHLEWLDGDGNMFGIIVGQAMMDKLFELEFPYRFDPVVDAKTEEWYVGNQTGSLDQELQDLL